MPKIMNQDSAKMSDQEQQIKALLDESDFMENRDSAPYRNEKSQLGDDTVDGLTENRKKGWLRKLW